LGFCAAEKNFNVYQVLSQLYECDLLTKDDIGAIRVARMLHIVTAHSNSIGDLKNESNTWGTYKYMEE
jgi:hypothetical protein